MSTTTREPVPVPSIPRDPRAVAAEVAEVQKRLAYVYESARRAFQSVPLTLDAMVAALEADAARGALHPRHFAARAGAGIEVYENVIHALTDAETAHDTAIATLAAHERELAKLNVATSVHDADYAAAMKEQTSVLVVADMELRALVQRIEPIRPSLTASVVRLVGACVMAARRAVVQDVTAKLHMAKVTADTARARQAQHATDEAGLLALVARMRTATGQALDIPEIVWPSGSDPFAPPVLK